VAKLPGRSVVTRPHRRGDDEDPPAHEPRAYRLPLPAGRVVRARRGGQEPVERGAPGEPGVSRTSSPPGTT
jgi:hypothetical protein